MKKGGDMDDGRTLVQAMHREAAERARDQPPPPVERPTVHHTELPEARPGDMLSLEWNTYRREVARLLAEGHDGKFVLIKGEEIVGLWNTIEEAKEVALQRYLLQPVLIHQVLRREPVLRGPFLGGRWPG
jgi:hypothetical protein